MKITDRIENIKGVHDCNYIYGRRELWIYYFPHIIDRDTLHIKVTKTITNLQLQESFKEYIYREVYITTKELEREYGKSRSDTDVLGLGKWKLGENIPFKDGKIRQLVHIECRNMAVDLLRFDDGTELFTEQIKDNFAFRDDDK